MIAKQEMTLSTAQQNTDHTQTPPQNSGSNNEQFAGVYHGSKDMNPGSLLFVCNIDYLKHKQTKGADDSGLDAHYIMYRVRTGLKSTWI